MNVLVLLYETEWKLRIIVKKSSKCLFVVGFTIRPFAGKNIFDNKLNSTVLTVDSSR